MHHVNVPVIASMLNWEPQAVGDREGKPSFLCWKGRGSTFQNPKHIGFLLLKKKARGHPMLIFQMPPILRSILVCWVLSYHQFGGRMHFPFIHSLNSTFSTQSPWEYNPKWSSAFHHFHYTFFPAFFWKIKPFIYSNIGYSPLKWLFHIHHEIHHS